MGQMTVLGRKHAPLAPLIAAAALAAGLALQAAARAQDAPSSAAPAPAVGPVPGGASEPIQEERSENKVLLDQAIRAFKQKDYVKAASLFEQLAAAQPRVLEYRLNQALSLLEGGKLPEARELYERILSTYQTNIEALVAVARISAKNAQGQPRGSPKRQEMLDQAREHLKRAAREGLPALRSIKLFPEFADFKGDVMLQLDLIKAPQTGPIETAARDPFHNPLPTKLEGTTGTTGTTGTVGRPLSDQLPRAEQEQLVKRLEQLFAELEVLIQQAEPDFDAVGKKWSEIEAIREKGKLVIDFELTPKFNDLMNRYREKTPIIRSYLLQYLMSEGDTMIKAMKAATGVQDHQRAMELWTRLETHAKRMVQTDDKFAQPASYLVEQGRPYYEKALKLKEIEQIKISVDAIIMGSGVSQAIINRRILSEGDMVFDQGGNPIPDLRIHEIKRRRVRFVYKGLEFEPRDQLKPKQQQQRASTR